MYYNLYVNSFSQGYPSYLICLVQSRFSILNISLGSVERFYEFAMSGASEKDIVNSRLEYTAERSGHKIKEVVMQHNLGVDLWTATFVMVGC